MDRRLLHRRNPPLARIFLALALLACPLPALAEDVSVYNELTTPAYTPLPDLEFLTPGDNGPMTSESWKGKVVVLNFWATWCTPCVKEMPSLNALAKSYSTNDVLVIPASVDTTDILTIKTFYRRHKLDALPVVWDRESASFKKLGLSVVPISVVIDPKGMMIGWVEGTIDWNGDEVHALIDKALEKRSSEAFAQR